MKDGEEEKISEEEEKKQESRLLSHSYRGM